MNLLNNIKNIFSKVLNIFNIHPDKNQRWLLLSMFFSGLLGTYISPAISKAIITELPAEWIAFESLVSSIAGLLIGMIWKGKVRLIAIKWFLYLTIAESLCGCLLGFYLCFIQYNVWVFAVCSLFYSTFICTFVAKCVMAFKAKLWVEHEREIYDNNLSIVSGIVCIIGFSVALLAMPSLKVSLFLWGLCCILDDIGWIIVYVKNMKTLKNINTKDTYVTGS